MSSKIDIRLILSDHFRTLQDEATKKISLTDLAIMLLLPLILAAGVSSIGYVVAVEHVNVIVSVFAIFAGLLLNLLVLIYGLTEDKDESGPQRTVKQALLHQSFANVSYSILVALLVVIVVGLRLVFVGSIAVILSFIFVFLTVNFLLSLLMILKRIHVLLRGRFPG